jgi:DNA repair protein RadC
MHENILAVRLITDSLFGSRRSYLAFGRAGEWHHFLLRCNTQPGNFLVFFLDTEQIHRHYSLPMPELPPPVNERTTEQLLAVLLRSDKNAAALAQYPFELLKRATWRELGITKTAYARLMAGIELGRRVEEAKAAYSLPQTIDSSTAAINFCQIHFGRLIADALQEQFHIVTLNTKNSVIDSHRITIGTLDASLVHPREVFRPAIKDSASSIILAHNHPSGDPTPSQEDYAVTKRLEQAGELVGIQILDHIVMGKHGLVSIKEAS